jgi:hypothetical protein
VLTGLIETVQRAAHSGKADLPAIAEQHRKSMTSFPRPRRAAAARFAEVAAGT